MMSHTYNMRSIQNDEIWKVEIFSRIIRYEKQFPELWSIAHKPQKVSIKLQMLALALLALSRSEKIIRANPVCTPTNLQFWAWNSAILLV